MRLIILNKPYHILCGQRSVDGRSTLSSFFDLKGFKPAGNLDYASEGLVLLTDHPDLRERLRQPRWKMATTYYLQVEKIPSDTALEKLRKGVQLGKQTSKPAKIDVLPRQPEWIWQRDPPLRFRKITPTTWLKMTIMDGRNRQIRSMTYAIGHPTLRLIRGSFGPITLGHLKPKQWREADPSEFAKILGFILPKSR